MAEPTEGSNIYQNSPKTIVAMILLQDDVVRSRQLIDDLGLHSAFGRRTLVRAVFALVEGTLSSMRVRVLGHVATGAAVLSDSEQLALREVIPQVDDRGEVAERPQFVPMANAVRLTFRLYARVFGCQRTPEFGGAGWQAFRSATEIRSRLTHPLGLADLEVSDAHLAAVNAGYDWFLRSTGALLEESPQGRDYDA
jgi:hypothetical protein